ncbi:MAG: sarcosine oxidase subunit delta [Alphaproteobacteria bacterium]|nr:sarcosine oxidase subunit delta [Alphaproteobacteria bacterium]
MLLITCPHCGPRAQIEFTYGGDATVRRPDPAAPLAAWTDYIYIRDNPRGPHLEFWQHHAGCRAWIKIARDTLTHEITGSAVATAALGKAGAAG